MPPIRVLTTGANGALGSSLIASLIDLNVCGAARTTPTRLPDGVTGFAVGALHADTDWSAALEGATHVVHCAGLTYVPDVSDAEAEAQFQTVNVAATVALARQAVRAGVKRLVYISSLTVNGKHSPDVGTPFSHADIPNPLSSYSRSKWDAERALTEIAADTGLEVVLVRIPRIVWPNLTGNLAMLEKLVAKGLPLPFGLIQHNARDNISSDNLLSALRVCITHPAAANQTFLISDQHPLSTRELVIVLGKRIGKSARLVPVPAWLLRAIVMAIPARLLGKMNRTDMLDELLRSLRIDSSHFERLTGWTPAPALL